MCARLRAGAGVLSGAFLYNWKLFTRAGVYSGRGVLYSCGRARRGCGWSWRSSSGAGRAAGVAAIGGAPSLLRLCTIKPGPGLFLPVPVHFLFSAAFLLPYFPADKAAKITITSKTHKRAFPMFAVSFNRRRFPALRGDVHIDALFFRRRRKYGSFRPLINRE